jgi:alcohol dehydrogenase (cytochrome c)
MKSMEAAMTRVRPMHRLALPALVGFVSTLLVGAGMAQQSEDGQWTMPGKDYASTRYSGLDDINATNAKGLHPVWTFSTGVLGGHQGQPLVVKNTMYVVTPYPNVLYAFDLSKEGYPLRWKYRPAVSPNSIGIACCGQINRGASYANGKIIYNLLDGHTVAVDAESGREVWMTTIADLSEGETTPMAPVVTKDRVIVGASGGEFGIYGWLKGLDLKTGEIVWTARNIGPDAEVLAKPGTFKSYYDEDDTELASKSWPTNAWNEGGAPVWGWISYDPDKKVARGTRLSPLLHAPLERHCRPSPGRDVRHELSVLEWRSWAELGSVARRTWPHRAGMSNASTLDRSASA